MHIGFFPNFEAILKHLLMYLNVFQTDLVLSASVQVSKAGHVVAQLYYDSKPRSYEDCVRYGSLRDFSSLSDCIDYFVRVYGKVTISDHS